MRSQRYFSILISTLCTGTFFKSFRYALSTAGMSATATGQESSTCWSLTILRRRRRKNCFCDHTIILTVPRTGRRNDCFYFFDEDFRWKSKCWGANNFLVVTDEFITVKFLWPNEYFSVILVLSTKLYYITREIVAPNADSGENWIHTCYVASWLRLVFGLRLSWK